MTASISLQTVAIISGLFFSALASIAACSGIWMAIRADRRARQPSLRIQALVSPTTRFYGAAITNVGDGAATGTHFVVADTTTFIMAPVLNGFLQPGETVEVFASCPVSPTTARHPVLGFVTARDRLGFVRDWTTAGTEYAIHQRPWSAFYRMCPRYGDVGTRLKERFPEETPGVESLMQVRVSKQVRR
jgi:hypothetical protein